MVAVIQKDRSPRQRALVVDDSRIARYVLGGLLDRQGFDVETTDSAEAALRKLAGDQPDIVFMDHLLPGMQGLDAVRRLREKPETRDLPIVMYTSQDGDAFASVARDAGADDVFVKTSDHAELENILGRLNLGARQRSGRLSSANVYPLRTARGAETGGDPLGPGTGTAMPEELLESLLDRHREKIRQDLLSEFAIMERYEERMRRDTMLRIDNMTKRAIASINRTLLEQQRACEERVAGRKRSWSWAIAFGLALSLGLAVGLMT